MYLPEPEKRTAHIFAGCGGDVCGMQWANWLPYFAIEINPYRCQTLRRNYPGLVVYEGTIQKMVLEDYPPGKILVFFITFPCDHYTLAANLALVVAIPVPATS